MNIQPHTQRSNTSYLFYALLSAMLLSIISCSSVLPVLTDVALGFAKDLISSSAQNYSPEYADQVEELFDNMVTPSVSPEEDSPQDADALAYHDETDSDHNYDTQQVELSDQEDLSIMLDVAVLVQRSSASLTSTPKPIEDGDTLFSDPNDPVAGDKLKLSFGANCDCYVYIIGIDGTGYVVPVFPDYVSEHSALVSANQQYIIPQADEWYGLDSYEGVEEFYFIASLNRRPDLERISKKFASQVRQANSSYRPVQRAAIVPTTRGIVKIKAGKPAVVQDSTGEEHNFTPMTFLSTIKGNDLVITRWFEHKNL